MLVLPTLHTYLSQLLSPPSIHTALLLTPEGALVSYASQTSTGSATFAHSPSSSVGAGGMPSSPSSVGSSSPSTPLASETGLRSKDEIRMAAGLGAEVWAETREEEEGMVESEVSADRCIRRVLYDYYSSGGFWCSRSRTGGRLGKSRCCCSR
jgi:hypothetical protein